MQNVSLVYLQKCERYLVYPAIPLISAPWPLTTDQGLSTVHGTRTGTIAITSTSSSTRVHPPELGYSFTALQ